MRRVFDRASLRVKATASLLAIVAVLQAIVAGSIIINSNEHIASEQTKASGLVAQGLASASELALAVGDREELARLCTSFLKGDAVFVAIYDQSGELSAHDTTWPEVWNLYQKGLTHERDAIVGKEHVWVTDAAGLDVDDESTVKVRRSVGYAVVGLSTQPMRQTQAKQMQAVLQAAGAMLLICGLVVYLTVGNWTKRLAGLVQASERMSRGDLGCSITVDRGDEIGRLAAGFEVMRQSLEHREQELQRFNETLHQKVEERTRDLKKATVAAEAAVRSKSEFLANMSHEIRTPMTAIVGYAELLTESAHTTEQRTEYAQTIRRNGEHLLVIINDILDISKIEAGKMQVERIACSPAQVVQEVASLMGVRAHAKGLTLKSEHRTLLPASIESDPTRLRQILMNLVGNAIKFTEKGEIRIDVGLVQEKDGARLRFDVVDTGTGMSNEQMDNLFRPFTQADTSTTRKFGGTGLGLSISKRLATILGGDIVVQSAPDTGSTFSLVLDVGAIDEKTLIDGAHASRAVLEAAPALKSPAALPLHARILLAEDGPDNQRLISHHLRKAGAEVEIAENGRLAFDAAMAAWRAGAPFDLIFMDMQMPELDGYDATALLRRHGYPGAIVALTAHAMAGDREKCIAAGCDDFASKPVNRVKLIETARQTIQAVRGRLSSAA